MTDMISLRNRSCSKKTQHILFVLISGVFCLTVTISGCKEVHFPEHQPKGIRSLATIPKSMQGRYEFPVDSAKVDTLVVTQNEFYPKNEYKDRLTIGDSLILKTYKGYYFFNLLAEDPTKTWLLRVVKPGKNGNLEVLTMDDGHFEEFLNLLSREIQIDSTGQGWDKIYTIDPTPKELIGLIKKGYFIKRFECKKLK